MASIQNRVRIDELDRRNRSIAESGFSGNRIGIHDHISCNVEMLWGYHSPRFGDDRGRVASRQAPSIASSMTSPSRIVHGQFLAKQLPGVSTAILVELLQQDDVHERCVASLASMHTDMTLPPSRPTIIYLERLFADRADRPADVPQRRFYQCLAF